METIRPRLPGLAGWLLITLIAVIYGPMAIEYFGSFYSDTAPQLWNALFSAVTTESHALGEGSVFREQHDAYIASLQAMTLHTIAGGFVILISVLQFSAGFRKKFPLWHRALGRIHFALVTLGMLAAMLYLLRTGPADTFDGPPFYLQLWALALGTLLSAIMAVRAIIKRQVAIHYSLMVYNLSLLMSAPGLRIGYLIFGGFDPSLTQELTNMASAIIYAFIAAPMAAVATRVMDKRKPDSLLHRQPVKSPTLIAIWISAVMISSIMGNYYFQFVDHDAFLFNSLLLTALSVTVVYGGALWLAYRKGHRAACYEWSTHFASLGMVPASCALLWIAIAQFFTVEQAFWGAVLVGPALSLSLGFLIAIWSRHPLNQQKVRIPAGA